MAGMAQADKQVAVEQMKLLMQAGGIHVDGWNNLASGVGTSADKSEYNNFTAKIGGNNSLFETMYRQDGITKTIIKEPAKDAMKNWVTIEGDDNGAVAKELKRLKAKQAFAQLIIHQRKFGGGAIWVQTSNGGLIDTPITTIKSTKITGLKNISKADFDIVQTDINNDPNSPNFEQIEVFKVRMRDGVEFKIHSSRLLILKGEKLDRVDGSADPEEDWFWGASVLEPMLEALGYYGTAMKAIATMLQESTITKFKMAGLADILADMGGDDEAAKEAWGKFQARIKAMVLTKSVIHSVLLDAESNEDLMRENYNFGGIPEIVSLNQMQVSGMSVVPITKLFGRSPAGENSTGESDNDNYNGLTMGIQEDVEPLVQDLVNRVTGSNEGFVVKFNHPDSPTQEETIEMRHKQAQTDEIYIKSGVLDPETVGEKRFEGEYSFETILEQGEAESQEGLEEEQQAVVDHQMQLNAINEAKVDELIIALDAQEETQKISKEDLGALLEGMGFNGAQVTRMVNR